MGLINLDRDQTSFLQKIERARWSQANINKMKFNYKVKTASTIINKNNGNESDSSYSVILTHN